MKRNLLDKPVERRKLLPDSVSTPRTQLTANRTASERIRGHQILTESVLEARIAIKNRIVLSVSNDIEFDKCLRRAALERGQIVIRVDSVDAAFRTIHTDCCGVTLLDLDWAGKTAWEMADRLLQDPKCPPVILLTRRGEQFGLKMAVQAGSILDKSADADRILKAASDVLEASHSVRAEQNAAQRVVIRWLSPCLGPVSPVPARRFWGINE